MLDRRGGIFHLDIREGVCPASIPHQQRVALRVVARTLGTFQHLHKTPVSILSAAGRDAFGDDRTGGVFSDMDHLRSGVGLLAIIGQGHGIKLSDGVIAFEQHTGILPGNR